MIIATPAFFWSLSSVQLSCSVVSDSLRPHELQHIRPPCPSPTLFAWNIFFQPFTFSLYVSPVLRWVSCRQHMSGSCFCIHSASLCLLPLHLSPFSPPDRERRVDSPALSARGSRPSPRIIPPMGYSHQLHIEKVVCREYNHAEDFYTLKN